MKICVETTLTPEDVRHILSEIPVFDNEGRYDSIADRYTYSETIRKKLVTLCDRLTKLRLSKKETKKED